MERRWFPTNGCCPLASASKEATQRFDCRPLCLRLFRNGFLYILMLLVHVLPLHTPLSMSTTYIESCECEWCLCSFQSSPWFSVVFMGSFYVALPYITFCYYQVRLLVVCVAWVSTVTWRIMLVSEVPAFFGIGCCLLRQLRIFQVRWYDTVHTRNFRTDSCLRHDD